ncbi:MAG: class I SAM-dependent RNA methyltransferase [Sporichthyaceae bacterium]
MTTRSGQAPDRRRNRPRPPAKRARPDLAGTEFEVLVGPPAHGGSCVARHESLVVFVRHALPGERVRVRVTEGREGDSFLRADAVEILAASPDRVPAPCEYAGPGGCGGCDWQHAALDAQRRLKATVVAEQLQRVGGIEWDGEVEAAPGQADGGGWRTRVRFAVDSAGRPGMRGHRSHGVQPVEECFIAHPAVASTGVLGAVWTDTAEIEVAVASSGERAAIVRASAGHKGQRARPRATPSVEDDVSLLTYWPPGVSGAERIVEHVGGRRFAVPAGGFWQVHPAAASTLVDAVRAALNPRPGEVLLDLYSGAGLFAGCLAHLVNPGGRVIAVESDAAAVVAARDNLLGMPGVEVLGATVADALAEGLPAADLVVLDPPRVGAGREVVEGIAALLPRRIAYVSCDPATQARDLRTFAGLGYELAELRAFDLFPMTHHVETLAVLVPSAS